MRQQYKRALTIAGSDSGGGAGIQADLKTFAALQCYGMSVITALTAQNTVGVQDIHGVPPAFITAQLDSIFSDIGVDAVKVGMLHAPPVIRAVANGLKKYECEHVVLDPVMVAKSGDRLLEKEAITSLKEELLPLAYCLTPNLPEAEVLLDRSINNDQELEQAARDLLDLGPDTVLVKGGHLQSEKAIDYLAVNDDSAVKRFENPKIETKNTHGTGCTLSSAIASFLARGYSIHDSFIHAKTYMTAAIKTGAVYQLGKGHGPVHHFYQWWED